VSANVNVEAQKIGSVMALADFCRSSPAWTAAVEMPRWFGLFMWWPVWLAARPPVIDRGPVVIVHSKKKPRRCPGCSRGSLVEVKSLVAISAPQSDGTLAVWLQAAANPKRRL
jgi:hypothetical protein